VVAHRVGEPFGTLVLALAATVIEMALIVSIASGEHRPAGCQSPQPERPTKQVHSETKRDDNNGQFDQALDRIA
jgi:hypothetical protein